MPWQSVWLVHGSGTASAELPGEALPMLFPKVVSCLQVSGSFAKAELCLGRTGIGWPVHSSGHCCQTARPLGTEPLDQPPHTSLCSERECVGSRQGSPRSGMTCLGADSLHQTCFSSPHPCTPRQTCSRWFQRGTVAAPGLHCPGHPQARRGPQVASPPMLRSPLCEGHKMENPPASQASKEPVSRVALL